MEERTNFFFFPFTFTSPASPPFEWWVIQNPFPQLGILTCPLFVICTQNYVLTLCKLKEKKKGGGETPKIWDSGCILKF